MSSAEEHDAARVGQVTADAGTGGEPSRVVAGRYRLEELIGKGGFGAVYRAVNLSIDQPIALKFMHAAHLQNEGQIGRFEQEARNTSKLRHPNVVQVFDFGRAEDGSLFMAMELLSGRPLSKLTKQRKKVPAARVCGIGIQICRGLGAAHDIGLIHRDLKPDNVFLLDLIGEEDFVKVLDFGIAKALDAGTGANLTATGMVVGTPTYMSPEQADGLKVLTPRSDLYSLGIILYELLAGVAPFRNESAIKLLIEHLTKPPPDLRDMLGDDQIPESLASAVMRLLSKDPDDRFESAAAVAKALEHARMQCVTGEWSRATRPGRSGSHGAAAGQTSSNDGDATVVLDSQNVSAAGARGRDASAGADGVPSERPPPTQVLDSVSVTLAAAGLSKASSEPRAPRRRLPVLALAAVVVLAGAAVWAWTSGALSDPAPRPPPPPQAGAPASRSTAAAPPEEAPRSETGSPPSEVPPKQPMVAATPSLPVVAPAEPSAEPTAAPAPEPASALAQQPAVVATQVDPFPPSAPGAGGPEKTVRLTVHTAPEGAVLWFGGEPLGATPLDHEPPQTGEPVEYRLELGGHISVRQRVRADRPGVVVVAMKAGAGDEVRAAPLLAIRAESSDAFVTALREGRATAPVDGDAVDADGYPALNISAPPPTARTKPVAPRPRRDVPKAATKKDRPPAGGGNPYEKLQVYEKQ